jgi:hypothetical protein
MTGKRAPLQSINHAIDHELGFKLLYGRIYNLSEVKLSTLKAFLKMNLANRFIQQSSSSVPPPILFANTMNGAL